MSRSWLAAALKQIIQIKQSLGTVTWTAGDMSLATDRSSVYTLTWHQHVDYRDVIL